MATWLKKKHHSVSSAKIEVVFILSSAYFFVRTSLPQRLLITSKKIWKWFLCLVVIKNYYGNPRVMSVTWNIGVFITFIPLLLRLDAAVAVQTFFIESLPLHFEKFRQGGLSIQNFYQPAGGLSGKNSSTKFTGIFSSEWEC